MKARAAILWDRKLPWSVEDIELDAPKAGEVLVRLMASGMCHSDDHLVTGDLPMALPMIGGHEGAGIVEEVGAGVTTLAPGDHIVFSYLPLCGRCPSCSAGQSNLCDTGALLAEGLQISDLTARHHAADGRELRINCGIGTFANWTVANEASCIKLPHDIPLDRACLLSCGVPTGWGAAVYTADVKPGETVVVIGCGGLGSCAVQGARLAGARTIVAVDPVEFKREKAQQFGATHAAASIEDAQTLVSQITNGRMADKVIMTIGVGSGKLVAPAMALAAKKGRVVVVNIHPAEETEVSLSMLDLTLMEKQLVGSIYGSANPRIDVPKILDLWQQGLFDLDGMITRTYTLDEVNDGYADMHAGKNIRGVIVHSH